MSVSGPPESQYPALFFNEFTTAFEGNSIACIFYGAYLVIAATNMLLLRQKRYRVLLLFSVVQLVVTTLYFAMSLYVGPAQCLAIFNIVKSDELPVWPNTIVNITFVLNTWTSDIFLLYRCHVIYMGNKYVVAFSAGLYLATLGSSLAWLINFTPGPVFSHRMVQVNLLLYWSCSAAMNVFVPLLISVRLWMYRKAIFRAFKSRRSGFYMTYMEMTLESALLYTLFSVVALVVMGEHSLLENIFFPALSTIQVIAPSLIVHRIARGIAFEPDRYGNISVGTLCVASCGDQSAENC